RRILPALLAALNRVVIALRADWQNSFVPRGCRCWTRQRFDGLCSGRGLEEREYKRDQRKSRIAHCGMHASIYRPADELQRMGPRIRPREKREEPHSRKWPMPCLSVARGSTATSTHWRNDRSFGARGCPELAAAGRGALDSAGAPGVGCGQGEGQKRSASGEHQRQRGHREARKKPRVQEE